MTRPVEPLTIERRRITGALLHRAWLKSGRPDPLIDDDAWDGFALTIVAVADIETGAARVAAPSDGLRELRALSDAAAPGPWQWLDGDDESADELQDGRGEMVASGFRENLVLDGTPINRDGTFAAAAVNYVRAALARQPGDDR